MTNYLLILLITLSVWFSTTSGDNQGNNDPNGMVTHYDPDGGSGGDEDIYAEDGE